MPGERRSERWEMKKNISHTNKSRIGGAAAQFHVYIRSRMQCQPFNVYRFSHSQRTLPRRTNEIKFEKERAIGEKKNRIRSQCE